jgi:hypothetical protein
MTAVIFNFFQFPSAGNFLNLITRIFDFELLRPRADKL